VFWAWLGAGFCMLLLKCAQLHAALCSVQACTPMPRLVTKSLHSLQASCAGWAVQLQVACVGGAALYTGMQLVRALR